MRNKNLSLELLKFIALFLIANSHMDILYGKYSVLATGGSIGDVLFFFCSGYTLFLGRMDRFDNWYKRRIYRIYPSIFAWALVASIFFNRHYDMKNILLHGGGWFVTCIMLYYIVLYFIRRFMFDRKRTTVSLVVLIIFVWYIFEDRSTFFMYDDTYFKWIHYFLFMVIGGYIGANKIRMKCNPMFDWVVFLISLITFYVTMFACTKSPVLSQFQIVSLIPLIGITIYLYKICSSEKIVRFTENNRKWICAISGLCLESYIVQYSLFTDKMNFIFPLNIVITMIAILVLAYFVRSLGRLFVQIFNKEELDWKAIVKI